MSRTGTTAAAVLGLVALALAITIVVRMTATSAAPTPILTAGGAPAPTAPPQAAVPHCTLPAVRTPARTATAALTLRGACRGPLAGQLGCVAVSDDLYLTAREQIDRDHVLYLTVNVEAFRQRPGDYPGTQGILQLTGPYSVERWSDYLMTVHVNADDSVEVPPSDLTADPGTGAGGTVTVSGHIGCEAQ